MTLCSIVSPEEDAEQVALLENRLAQVQEPMAETMNTETKLIRHTSIEEGILEESQKYDAVVIGATRDSFTRQILFGSIPETMARDAQCTVIIV